jgi:hypothetical protein
LNIEQTANARERRYESKREGERKNPVRYIEFKRNERRRKHVVFTKE